MIQLLLLLLAVVFLATQVSAHDRRRLALEDRHVKGSYFIYLNQTPEIDDIATAIATAEDDFEQALIDRTVHVDATRFQVVGFVIPAVEQPGVNCPKTDSQHCAYASSTITLKVDPEAYYKDETLDYFVYGEMEKWFIDFNKESNSMRVDYDSPKDITLRAIIDMTMNDDASARLLAEQPLSTSNQSASSTSMDENEKRILSEALTRQVRVDNLDITDTVIVSQHLRQHEGHPTNTFQLSVRGKCQWECDNLDRYQKKYAEALQKFLPQVLTEAQDLSSSGSLFNVTSCFEGVTLETVDAVEKETTSDSVLNTTVKGFDDPVEQDDSQWWVMVIVAVIDAVIIGGVVGYGVFYSTKPVMEEAVKELLKGQQEEEDTHNHTDTLLGEFPKKDEDDHVIEEVTMT